MAIELFPASALGNEPTINRGLALGTVDMIYAGAFFAAATYRPIGIGYAPCAFRDYVHFAAYRDSNLMREMATAYGRQTGHRAQSMTYYETCARMCLGGG